MYPCEQSSPDAQAPLKKIQPPFDRFFSETMHRNNRLRPKYKSSVLRYSSVVRRRATRLRRVRSNSRVPPGSEPDSNDQVDRILQQETYCLPPPRLHTPYSRVNLTPEFFQYIDTHTIPPRRGLDPELVRKNPGCSK